jgi:hypothetical protein
VVVDRYGEVFLGIVLTDHVLIEVLLDHYGRDIVGEEKFVGFGGLLAFALTFVQFFLDDFGGLLDTHFADVGVDSGDENQGLGFIPSTEGTSIISFVFTTHNWRSFSSW